MALRVREAAASEYAVIAALTVDAYAAVFGRDGLHEYEAELRDVATRASVGTVLVAVDDSDEVVGAVGYVPGPTTPMSEFDDPDACGIRMLAVAPSRQGMGAGRALTEACLERGRASGCRLVVLHSTEKMVTARGLYERMGFTRTTERDVLIPAEEAGGDEPFLLMAYVRDL
jgi:ribosomal protein S18 acetylase RimI-like enzyme